jgi:hypothetical protein
MLSHPLLKSVRVADIISAVGASEHVGPESHGISCGTSFDKLRTNGGRIFATPTPPLKGRGF